MTNLNLEIRVKDIGLDEILSEQYDLSIFASGYEERCTHFIQKLRPLQLQNTLVIGFKDSVLPDTRIKNDKIFSEISSNIPLIPGSQFPTVLSDKLIAAVSQSYDQNKSPKILIDYSSMCREWYGYALSVLCQITQPNKPIQIDFVYSPGRYPESYKESLDHAVLESLAPLIGMEGLSASRPNSIAMLGLGFSPVAGLGALERLQPEKVFCFLAGLGSQDNYLELTRERNKRLIRRASAIVELPLLNLSSAYRGLVELAWPYVDRYHVNILPMGPKPHVLASMLVSKTFRAVSCLYGRVKTPPGTNVQADGRLSACTVTIVPKSEQPNEDGLLG